MRRKGRKVSKLNKSELEVLINILKNSKKINTFKVNLILTSNGLIEQPDEIEIVLDILSEELSKKGFNKNDEPNLYGIQIENLISFYSNLLIKKND